MYESILVSYLFYTMNSLVNVNILYLMQCFIEYSDLSSNLAKRLREIGSGPEKTYYTLLNKSLAQINKKLFLCAQSIQNFKISAQMMV